jgi:hypothetical protein
LSNIATIRIDVDWSASAQTLTIKTSGARGTTNLNDINPQTTFAGHSPLTTSSDFYKDVLTKALTML